MSCPAPPTGLRPPISASWTMACSSASLAAGLASCAIRSLTSGVRFPGGSNGPQCMRSGHSASRAWPADQSIKPLLPRGLWSVPGCSGKLKALEAVQLRLDAFLMGTRGAFAYPAPFLQEELAGRAIGLDVDGGDDLIAREHRQGEI